MELNRRGFFFSLISLLLLIGLFFLAQPRAYEATLIQERASQDRIVFTNAIITNFETGYLARAIESQTYLVLEAITEHREDRLYTSRDDFEADFTEGLINGTLNGTPVSDYLTTLGLDGAQRDLIELLELYANASGQNYNIDFDFAHDPNAYEVRLFQDENTGPWQVGVELRIPYNVTPGAVAYGDQIANWTLDRTVTTYASIRGIRDPYLHAFSEETINVPIEEFYTERWSRGVFEAFVNTGRYVPYNKSLSVLGRYYDSLEYSTCCGILTTINRTRYDDYNDHIPDGFSNVTFMDCGYFPGSAATSSCRADQGLLVYAIDGFSDYTLNVDRISSNASNFPFTVGGRIGTEFFNMTFDNDLYDTYEAITS